MKIGVVFPQTEFGHDPAALKEYAQTVEELGYTHILAYDHVLGANPERPGGWKGPYTFKTSFLEVFVLLSTVAAVTKKLELVTGILILPQRQTALVAKQAATLDVLSGSRLRLGVGLGWNEVEYDALGMNFHNRGRRIEDQVKLMQKLWAEPLVVFDGRYDKIPDAGINPLPLKRKIPIWFGGAHEHVMQRVAKFGDGWMPNSPTVAQIVPQLEQLDKFLKEAGRSRNDIGIEARLHFKDMLSWEKTIAEWKSIGVTHLTVNTMGVGLNSPQQHIAAIKDAAKRLDLAS